MLQVGCKYKYLLREMLYKVLDIILRFQVQEHMATTRRYLLLNKAMVYHHLHSFTIGFGKYKGCAHLVTQIWF